MSNFSFNGNDLSNIFMPLGSISASDTGYKYFDDITQTYKDINTLYEKYTSGAYAPPTNYLKNGQDLNQIFQYTSTPIEPPFTFGGPGATSPAIWTSYNGGGYYVYFFSGTSNIILNTPPPIALSFYAIGGGGGGSAGLGLTTVVTNPYAGGGGAAGGYFTGYLSAGIYSFSISVGTGGTGGTGTTGETGTTGGTTTISITSGGTGSITCNGGNGGAIYGNASGGTSTWSGAITKTSNPTGAVGGNASNYPTNPTPTAGSNNTPSSLTLTGESISPLYIGGGGGGGLSYNPSPTPAIPIYGQAGSGSNIPSSGQGGAVGTTITASPASTFCTGTSPASNTYGGGGGGGGSYAASTSAVSNVNGGSGSSGFAVVFIPCTYYKNPIYSVLSISGSTNYTGGSIGLNTYKIIFNPGTFTITFGPDLNLNMLVIGGGGGGASGSNSGYSPAGGGGGGAGGIGTISNTVLSGTSYTIQVGNGGAKGIQLNNGSPGGTSSFGSLITSTGGGGGNSFLFGSPSLNGGTNGTSSGTGVTNYTGGNGGNGYLAIPLTAGTNGVSASGMPVSIPITGPSYNVGGGGGGGGNTYGGKAGNNGIGGTYNNNASVTTGQSASASSYGSGAGGGSYTISQTNNYDGGIGAPGVVIITFTYIP